VVWHGLLKGGQSFDLFDHNFSFLEKATISQGVRKLATSFLMQQ